MDLDITEPVNGPTLWINPVVIVPKLENDVRLCLDMRQANEEHFPLPTVDELLQGLNGSAILLQRLLKASCFCEHTYF